MEELPRTARVTMDVSGALKPISFTRLKWCWVIELTEETFLLNRYKSLQFSDCKKCSLLTPWECKLPKKQDGRPHPGEAKCAQCNTKLQSQVLQIHLFSAILSPSLHISLLLASLIKKKPNSLIITNLC